MSEICTKSEYCRTIHERQTEHRGFRLVTFYNRKSKKIVRSNVIHFLSAKDGGLVFNFCPWCGFDFSKRKDWPKNLWSDL